MYDVDNGFISEVLWSYSLNLTLNDLTVNFSHCNSNTLLSDWHWLIGKNRIPILITAFGEPFLQDRHSREIFFLNICDGALTKVASNSDEFKAKLSLDDFWDKYLPLHAVGDLRLAGHFLDIGQVYSYKQPPILGGKHEIENIEICDIEVHFSILGQIHFQVKDLPEGTPISNVRLNSVGKPWWKFWG